MVVDGTVAYPPVEPAQSPRASRVWIGAAFLLAVIAVLVGMNAVLFTRVQHLQRRVDDAVTIATAQNQIQTRIDALDTSVRSVGASQQDASAQLDTVSGQVSSLRKCVNNALDAVAQATQSRRSVSITKC
jgi:hypothetical protein